MSKWFARILLIFSFALTTACWGQGAPDQLNFLGSNFEGFQFYGVSAFLNYASYQFPPPSAVANSPATSDWRSNYGVSGTVGWQRLRGKFNFAARYTGSYTGNVRASEYNRLGHSFNFTIARPLGRKWTLDITGSGRILSIEQYLFEPSFLGSLSQSQGSVSDLGAALSNNPQTALQLGGANSGTSPTSALLLGSYLMTYAANASLNYQATSRLSFSFGSVAAGGQHLAGNSAAASNYVTPHTLGGDAGVSMRYSLTPRTEIELGASGTYVTSKYQRAVSSGLYASISRKMSEHWFVRVNAGGSRSTILQQVAGTPPALQLTYGASTGYRTRATSIVATYSQSGSDQSSGVLGKNTNLQAAWSWRPPRSGWLVSASYGRNETSSTGFSTISGWRATANFSHSLPWNLVMSGGYSYLNSHGLYLGSASEVTVDGLRVSFGWTPTRRRMTSVTSDPEE